MIAKISAPIMKKAFAETECRRSQIQGFYCMDANRHWVEDVSLGIDQRVRWTQHGPDADYEKLHALKREEVERLQMQIVCEWLTENSPVTYHDI